METLEMKVTVGNEQIEIWRYGVNDYAINYINGDCSVRGTFEDIIKEIAENCGGLLEK